MIGTTDFFRNTHLNTLDRADRRELEAANPAARGELPQTGVVLEKPLVRPVSSSQYPWASRCILDKEKKALLSP